MKNNANALTLAAYLSMLFLGVATTLVGAAARNINLTPYQIGLFLTFQNIGFMVGVWTSGALADMVDKTKILLAGSIILAISFLTFFLTDILWLNLLIMTIIGVGVGSYEGVTDPMLLAIHTKRKSLHININHFFVTFGSILITLYLIILEMDWRISLTQSAVAVSILALFYAVARLDNSGRQSEDYLQRLRLLARERLVVVLFVVTVLVVGTEMGTSGILTTYLMELRGFTQTTSKMGLLTFLAGIAVGRLIFGFFSRRENITQTLLILFALSTAAFLFLYTADLGRWAYLPIFLAGLSMSALFPLVITLTGLVYPQMAGTVLGSIKVAIPVGGILLPFLMSLVARQISFQAALLIFPAALMLATLLLWLAFRRAPVVESTGS